MIGVSEEENKLKKELLRIGEEDNEKAFVCYDPIRVPIF